MVFINENLAEVPDEMPRVQPGKYEFEIVSLEKTTFETRKGTADVLDVALKIVAAENEENEQYRNMRVFDRIFLTDGSGKRNERGFITLKRLVSATGNEAPSEGIDTDDLIGQSLFATVKHRPYKNRNDEERISVDIDKYLVSDDQTADSPLS